MLDSPCNSNRHRKRISTREKLQIFLIHVRFQDIKHDLGLKSGILNNKDTNMLSGVALDFDIAYKKRLLQRCIHHFKSDLITNMDHMRISGTEPLNNYP